MISESAELPTSASVVIVGAGMAGLTAARELEAAGVTDVVVVEARDRIGGRVAPFVRPNGRVLGQGAEFTGAFQVEVNKLAVALGVETEPIPFGGKFVRIHNGERFEEEFPLESDPEAAAEFEATLEKLMDLAGEVEVDRPWAAPHAFEWDRTTAAAWLDENVTSPLAREMVEFEFAYDMKEISLLYFVWWLARFGEFEGLGQFTHRFVGGSHQLPEGVAAQLAAEIHLSAPVRTVDYSGDRVRIATDRGAIEADYVILAIEPNLAAGIEFVPTLPAARDTLQNRWLAGYDAKYFAIYDRPFWREQGLAGAAMGPAPVEFLLDLSPASADEGVLVGRRPLTPARWRESQTGPGEPHTFDVTTEPEKLRELILDELVSFFGEEARTPKEFYAFDWIGDRWSRGSGTMIPLGILSTVGHAWRAPIDRIHWAGADTGKQDWLEGAVTSGQRAATEVHERLKGTAE
ncbi:flavin monoamine oxidase family protein [Microbacterium gorillae]|uniref:flavin monoamine oxidase family protein n=1 Tax=Microbacterium gorillae TaxID=1231063 RepID=UPI000694446E|nr:FAD-dependent oxidoreductase [Microbacterium gorillae]